MKITGDLLLLRFLSHDKYRLILARFPLVVGGIAEYGRKAYFIVITPSYLGRFWGVITFSGGIKPSQNDQIEISYSTIHRIVRYELRGKLKVPRPIHEKQKPGIIEAFKNHFPTRIKGLINGIREKWGSNRSISYWFQDETRLGYRTESGQKITRVGIKPKQILQWHYSYYYIYGAECARRQAPEFNSGEPAGLVNPVG